MFHALPHWLALAALATVPYVAITLLVVFVHEFGHYWAGRLVGAPIEAFSVGFGRELLGWSSRLGVRWKLCAIPFGGYVKFLGDADASSRPDSAAIVAMPASVRRTLLSERPGWQRAFVLVAGPGANFAFAVLVMAGFFMAYGLSDFRPLVGSVNRGSPAAAAGLLAGDQVVAVDGRPARIFRDMRDAVQDSGGAPVSYLVRRGPGPLLEFQATPVETPVRTAFGTESRFLVGIQASAEPSGRVVMRFGLAGGLSEGAREVWRIARMTLDAAANVAEGRIPLSTLSGPVKIAHVASVTASEGGLRGLVGLLAVISASVGLINLFPIPVLDGGHLAIIAVEGLAGRRLSEAVAEAAYRVGFACLCLLVITVTANDLLGVLRGG